MSQRQLTIEKRITEITGQGSHRLQMWVTDYQDIDPNVFVYQRLNPVPPAVDPSDEYVNIASAADMVEYPIDNPDPALPQFFRKTAIDIIFRSVDLMNRSIEVMESDLRNMVRNLDILDIQGEDDTIIIEGSVIP